MKSFSRKLSLWLSHKGEIAKITTSVTPEAISSAYDKRKKEITSLRQYDRGEKTIDAPDIGKLVQSI